MIRAGRFYAVLITDGYEVHDDVHGLVSRVELPVRSSRSRIKREASGDVAKRHHDMQRQDGNSPRTGR